MDWQDQLIALYLFVCNQYRLELHAYCERFTNHAELSFSDEEVITLYLFGVIQKRKLLKEIFTYADQHVRDWFPKMPATYTVFVQRINRVASAFISMVEALLKRYPGQFELQDNPLLIDSMPIILAHRSRRFKAKVAPEIATKNGYCSTKKLHYYGVKLHILARRQTGQLPMPEYIGLTEAGMHDNKGFELIAPALQSDDVFGDKAYNDCFVVGEKNFNLYTPVKKQKGQEFLDAADQLWSTAVSCIRQPIESFFNWVEDKTGIQIASKVRSFNGLMVTVTH